MDPLALMALIGLGLTAMALFNGIVSMAHGGEADQRASHLLMFRRVGWQAVTALAVLLALLGYVR
jgi:hypothetical protein